MVTSDGDTDDPHGEEPNIRSLRLRKIELERHLAAQTRQRDSIRAVLEGDQTSCALELVIRPRVLVPDTNCFIDHLVGIRRLVDSARYTVVVPLVGESVVHSVNVLNCLWRKENFWCSDRATRRGNIIF